MFIVGIDIAKHTHQASVMNTDGSLVGKSIKIPNTSVGFDAFISKLKEIDRDISHFEFGMEATGHYWLNIYTHLADLGCIVHVINPVQSDALRGLYIRQTKNDIKDSAIIADVIRIGRYCETSVSDDKMLALRDLTRQRFYLVDMVSDLKRKSLTLIDRIFPEYPTLFSDTFGTTSLELLANCNTPEDILAIETDKLVEMLSTASKGRFKQDKAEKIKETARNSFGALLCTDSASFMLKQFVEQIRFLENQIDELDEMISESLAELDSPITTITGIGDTLGAAILSEIGDIERFESADKLAAFAGMYADSLAKEAGCLVCICDMDQVVAASGNGRKEVQEKYISKVLQGELEERNSILAKVDEKKYIRVFREQEKDYVWESITPIICEGDVVGAVILLSSDEKEKFTKLEQKLGACAAGFLGKQME